MSCRTGRLIHRDCTFITPCYDCLKRRDAGAVWPEHAGVQISWCERDRISADGV